MEKKGANHSLFSKHSYEVLEVIGNIVVVALFIGITYLILRYLIEFG